MKQTDQSLPPSRPDELRIFIVEDSLLVRELIIENLAKIEGICVVGFSDSEGEALEQLRQIECDALILDIELKQGNGLSLLRSLKQNHLHADDIKIIFSNNVSDTYRRLGAEYGVSHFFDKTSEFPNLYSLIERLGTCSSPP